MSKEWEKPIECHHAELYILEGGWSQQRHPGVYVDIREWRALNVIFNGLMDASALATTDLLGDKVCDVFADLYERRCERD